MIVAGIDAGGTGVRIRVVDLRTGETRAEGTGPSAPDGGPDPAVALLRNTGAHPLAVCAGIAKHTRAGVAAAWRDALRAALPDARIAVEPDYQIAFDGALSGDDGVLVLSGTGSAAFARRADVAIRIGGRGWEYGDEGSGAHLTNDATRRTLRALDGLGPASPLTDAVALWLGTRDPAGAAEAARRAAERDGRGFLVPLVLERARAGDPEAADLFVGAAGWLARIAVTAARRAGWSDDDPVRIAWSGGLWNAGALLEAPFATVVRRSLPVARIGGPDGSALDGAVARARAMANAPAEG